MLSILHIESTASTPTLIFSLAGWRDAQLIKIVRPELHHRSPLLTKLSPVVRSPETIFHGMSELSFDNRLSNAEALNEDRSRCRSESMPRHLRLAEAHSAKSRVDGRIAHWPITMPLARKDESTMAR
jgi:hypothetical protein